MTSADDYDPLGSIAEHLSALGSLAVTGASGFIGSRLAGLLEAAGASPERWTRHETDLTDPAAVRARIDRDRPDSVFHLAATGLDDDTPKANSNVVMAVNLAEALPVRTTLIYSGTVSEYGRSGILDESIVCTPVTAYGRSKLAAAMAARAICERRGVRFVHARLFGVYGPGEGPTRLFPALIQALATGKPIALSDGLQQRDFLHVDDACAALVALGACGLPGPVNVGTGRGVLVRDAACWVADAMGVPRDLLGFGMRKRSAHDFDVQVAAEAVLAACLGARLPQRIAPGLDLALFSEGTSLSLAPVGSGPCR